MERPVIASAHGGSLELIKNNYTGFLFKPKSAQDLADKIKYLLLLPQKEKEKIVKRAKELVNKKYNIDNMCELNLKLYNSIVQ